MRTALLVCLVCIVGTLLVPAALAQERVIAMEKGKTMLSGTFLYIFDIPAPFAGEADNTQPTTSSEDSDSDADDSFWLLDLNLLKFVTDQTAVGLLAGLSHNGGTSGHIGLRLEHHFYNKENPKRTIPYVTGMGIRWLEEDYHANGWGVGVGAKVFTSENTFIAPEFEVLRIEGETVKVFGIIMGTLF